MATKNDTSAIVDGLLKFLLTGGTITAALVLPNALVALDKPLQYALNKLDKRARERELKRVLNYMKRKNLVNSANYEHGIAITKAGQRRAENSDFERLTINKPRRWDENWRIVFFDIPESKRGKRLLFTTKLRQIGFRPLQLSTWIHPFPCRQEIEIIALTYGVQRYISYIETAYIDNQQALIKKFQK